MVNGVEGKSSLVSRFKRVMAEFEESYSGIPFPF
jgi:hypothetical protein